MSAVFRIRIHSVTCIILSLVLLVNVATTQPCGAAVSYQTISMVGYPVPEIGPYTTVLGVSLPVINNAGEVAYVISTSSWNQTNSLWAGDIESPEMIANFYSEVPGEGSDVYLSISGGNNFSPADSRWRSYNLVLNDQGSISFGALYYGTSIVGTNDQAILTTGADGLDKVIRDGDLVPEFGSDVVVEKIYAPLFTNSGQTLVQYQVSGTGIDTTNDWAISIYDGSSLQTVLRRGQDAPDTSDGSTILVFSHVQIGDSGQVIIRASMSDPDSLSGYTFGLWAGQPSSLKLIARQGDPAPGLDAGGVFAYFRDVAINSTGSVVFTSEYDQSSPYEAMWQYENGSTRLVAEPGDILPGLVRDVELVRIIGNPVINQAGQIAFKCSFYDPQVDYSYVGIWIEDHGELIPIIQTSRRIPGVEEGSLHYMRQFYLNGAGQVAFVSSLDGVDFTIGEDTGLFVTDRNGLPQLITATGMLFDVNDDPLIEDLRTVSEIELVGQETDPETGRRNNAGDNTGLPRAFNDNGQIVFHLTFTDGTEGIFLASVSIPGDLNSDGYVGLDDLDIVLDHWNQDVAYGDALAGDYSGDGFVGLDDLDAVLNNWNSGTPPVADVIPEPGVGLVMLVGIPWVMRRK